MHWTMLLLSNFLTAAQLIAQQGPVMMHRPEPTVTIPSGRAVSLPLQSLQGRPIVEVALNGKGPFKFLLDTGAGLTLVSLDVAQQLKLPVEAETRVGSPVNPEGVPGKIVRVDRATVGEVEISGITAIALDFSHLFAGVDVPRGILSAAMFRGFLLTLDYPQNKMVIAKGELPPADAAEIFEYKLEQQLPTVPLSVAGLTVEVHLDSGSPGGITLPGSYIDRLPLVAKPVAAGVMKVMEASYPLTTAKLNGEVKLGHHVFDHPDLRFGDALPIGNIGYEILRHFQLILDTGNHRLRLSAPEH
jgi:hypothetical protein